MGYDKLFQFFSKNLSNNFCFDFDFKNKSRKIISENIFFDMNFFIYKNIKTFDDKINYFIKLILNIKQTKSGHDKINKFIKDFDFFQFENIYNKNLNEKENISNIVKFLKANLLDIFTIYVFTNVLNYIICIHDIKYLKSINFFFDGIPSYSKILEQRRRRVTTYVDSINNKKIMKDIHNFKSRIVTEDNIKFDYFDWLEHRFSISKNISSIHNLNIELAKRFKKFYINNKIKINISDNNIKGESDFKIFKYIKEKNILGNITIHSCDSDFLLSMITKQLKYNMLNLNINLNLIRPNIRDNYVKYININDTINLLIKKYKIINNINNCNNKFIFDLIIIFMMFGNDVIPESNYLGIEYSLNTYMNYHFKTFKNVKLIFCEKEYINFKNLSLYLNNFKKNSELFLNREYNLNYYLKYKIKEVGIKDPYEFYLNYRKYYLDNTNNNPLSEYKNYEELEKMLNINIEKDSNLIINLQENNFENFYVIKNFMHKKKPIFSDEDFDTKSFLENIYINFKIIYDDDYKVHLNYYPYQSQPDIISIINFINTSKLKFLNINIDYDYNFNNLSHYILITPYIFDTNFENNYFEKKPLFKFLKKYFNKNFWFNFSKKEDFNLRFINPKEYLKKFNNIFNLYLISKVPNYRIKNKIIYLLY
jgi:hypothetical protein